MEACGGFQSGFTSRTIDRNEAKYPQFLICNHGCQKVIQLISNVSNEPEFELCAVEAAKMSMVLITAAIEHLPDHPDYKLKRSDQL